MASRRDRRARGRRELKRTVESKTLSFIEMYERGYSRETMASTLGFTREEIDHIVAASPPREAIVRSGEGGTAKL